MIARQSKLFRGRDDIDILRKVISKTCLAHQLMSPKREIFKLTLKKIMHLKKGKGTYFWYTIAFKLLDLFH